MKIAIALFSLVLAAFNAFAEIQTLTYDSSTGGTSAVIQVTAQQTLQFKSMLSAGTIVAYPGGEVDPYLVWTVNGLKFTNNVADLSTTTLSTTIFAGPGSFQLFSPHNTGSRLAITFDIEPCPYPPDKTLTIGANSGNVTVTMENSTDLVNWTPAQNGATYTNAPGARFFRIKMNVNSP